MSNNKGQAFPQLVDLFSLPWANLLATVIGYFDNQKIEFEPQGLYNDIAVSIQPHFNSTVLFDYSRVYKTFISQVKCIVQ